jgi:drug/metabolite transporter (DMT)-like permease
VTAAAADRGPLAVGATALTARAATAAPDERTVASHLPALAMVAIVLCWGMGPPMSKLISAPPLVTVLYRLWLSVPILLVANRVAGGKLSWALLRRTAIPGALFGANLALVFASFHHATIAVISVIGALQPGLVLAVSGRLFGERPTAWHLCWTVVGIGGTAVVIFGAGSEVHTSALGVLLSTLSLVTFTIYFLATKRARAGQPITALEWMVGATFFAALAVTPVALVVSERADYGQVDGIDWLWMAFVVLVTGILGHALMSWAHRFVQASRSSLYLLAMNVVAIAAAWPIHDEPITVVQAIGGVIVLGAVASVVSRPPARVTGS